MLPSSVCAEVIALLRVVLTQGDVDPAAYANAWVALYRPAGWAPETQRVQSARFPEITDPSQNKPKLSAAGIRLMGI